MNCDASVTLIAIHCEITSTHAIIGKGASVRSLHDHECLNRGEVATILMTLWESSSKLPESFFVNTKNVLSHIFLLLQIFAKQR